MSTEYDDIYNQLFDIVLKNPTVKGRVRPIIFGGVFFNLLILVILVIILLKVNAIHYSITGG